MGGPGVDFGHEEVDMNVKEGTRCALEMRSGRCQVLVSDLKRVPTLALGWAKFRVHLTKCPKVVAISIALRTWPRQHFKVLWYLLTCLDGAKIAQRVRE